jgi:hypothetical protein
MHLAMFSQTDADFPDPCSMIVLHVLDALMLHVNAPRPGDQCDPELVTLNIIFKKFYLFY